MFSFFFTVVVLGQALVGITANADAFTTIPVGSSLHANRRDGPTSWLSSSNRFAFGFHQEGQGFIIGITMYVSPVAEPSVIWTAAGDEGIKPVSNDAVLSFTKKGFLLTPFTGAKTIALIKFNGTKSTGAAMLDSGNFMVYEPNPSNLSNCSSLSVRVGGDIKSDLCNIWQSFDNPTDTMMGGQMLACGTDLISRHNLTDTSFYKLSMQCDSNLVLYKVTKTITPDGNTTTASDPIWPFHWGYSSFMLSEDGYLFLSNINGTGQFNLILYNPEGSKANMLYHVTLASTKYLRLFELNLVTNTTSVVYQIPTLNDDCQTEYHCGMNSYCMVIDNNAECRCLPGFNFTDIRAPTKGCQRSIPEPNCWPQGSSDATVFSMESVDNLVWYDEAYNMVPAESKEDCRSTCLSECNCEAAIFFNKNCAKHKLPISHTTKDTNFTTDISTAYIKITTEGSGRNAEENQRQEKYMAVLLCGVIDAGVFLSLLFAGTGSYWLFFGRYRLLWCKWELAFQEEVAPRSFSYQEVAKATSFFAWELGRGGHATVFKGYLTMYGRPSPVAVAVKRLGAEDVKGENDFQAEIKIIGRAHHVNLVRLLGFCYEESKRLLIYEFMSRGSLADLINQSHPPSWKQIAGILLGVARGLNYLHRECEAKIIHRDIKPENILIAENWSAKISDFGISKLSVGGLQAISTKRTSPPGTPGYMAPECIRSNGENVTEKADVYSFGIVVLETVFWERNTEGNNLLESTPKYRAGMEEKRRKKLQLADAELEKAELEKENMMKLGMLCVQENPDVRPDMEDVILSILEGVSAESNAAAAVSPQIATSGKKV